MTSFDDYLREVRLSVENFDALPADAQERYRINGYNEWLKLKNQQPDPGSYRLRWRLIPFMLSFPWFECLRI